MSRAVLSVGSNLGDRLANLQLAIDELGPRVQTVSAVYATAPWGPVPQPEFYNCVVIARDERFGAWDWLHMAQEIEAKGQRERLERWGPRTLDVDIVSCDDVVSHDPALVLPHPRAAQRAFVLVPWLDVDPDAALNHGSGARAVSELIAALAPEEIAGVRRIDQGLRVRT